MLEAALRIHNVEAGHASKSRRLRRMTGAPSIVRLSGTISGGERVAADADNIPNLRAAVTSALGSIYAGEGNTTQGGIDVTTLPNLPTELNVARLRKRRSMSH